MLVPVQPGTSKSKGFLTEFSSQLPVSLIPMLCQTPTNS